MDKISKVLNIIGEHGFLYRIGSFAWNFLKELLIRIKKLFKLGSLPDYIIIGVQKGGTSSLQSYLNQHPEIFPGKIKEVHFFDHNFHKGPEWYKACFPDRRSLKGRVTGEATPYYFFHPLVPERIHDTAPNVKLILILRNPVDRAYSHYNMEVTRKNEKLTFEEAVAKENERIESEDKKLRTNPKYKSIKHQRYSYCSRGLYVDQLKRWLEYFPKEKILILESRELLSDTEAQLNRVFNFLNISDCKINKLKKLNKGKYRERMSPEIHKRLVDYFKPYNEALYKFIGHDFKWE